MKKGIAAWICFALLLSLCACSAPGTGASGETASAPVQAESEPVPAEPVTELVVEALYYCSVEENASHYACNISIFPFDGLCRIYNPYGDSLRGTCSVDDAGNLLLDVGGEICTFSRKESSLVLESGTLYAYSENGSAEIGAGAEFTLSQEIKLYDGIYVLDTSEYAFSFDEVLLDVDLTDMRLTLRCFDGNVVSGSLGFEEGYLVCSYPGGRLSFSVNDNTGGASLHSVTSGATASDQLMFCPQTDGSPYHKFFYAKDRTDELTVDPDLTPLDSRKQLMQETFIFQTGVESSQGEEVQCSLYIRHYPLTNTWEFQKEWQSTKVNGTENPDGSITLSLDGQSWRFHREDGCLFFDGGSALTANNWPVEGETLVEVQLEPGAAFYNSKNSYIYDATYILPGASAEEPKAAVRLDPETQRVLIQCADGTLLEGPYVYSGTTITCLFGLEDIRVNLFPSGHALLVTNPWNLTIFPDSEGGNTYFFPTQDTDEMREALRFIVEYPEKETLPEDSLLVFEEYVVASSLAGYIFDSSLVLCPHDGSFCFSNEYTPSYREGLYTDENGTVTLDSGGDITQLRRGETGLIFESGSPLYLTGIPFTATDGIQQEFPVGALMPLYTQGYLCTGTYTIRNDSGTASVHFDVPGGTFELTAADGSVYAGTFRCENKFVICEAEDIRFQFIPYGKQVRLNQKDSITVLPDSGNYIYFDFTE